MKPLTLFLRLGDFYERPKEKGPLKGDRAPIKKPEDNLRPEGDFARRESPTGGPLRGERADIKKPVDNLKLNGTHEPRKRSPGPGKGERAVPAKPIGSYFNTLDMYQVVIYGDFILGKLV